MTDVSFACVRPGRGLISTIYTLPSSFHPLTWHCVRAFEASAHTVGLSAFWWVDSMTMKTLLWRVRSVSLQA